MAIAAKRLSDIGGASRRVIDDERDHGCLWIQAINLFRSRGETDGRSRHCTLRDDLSRYLQQDWEVVLSDNYSCR
jgi:hypothetical protein